MRALLLLALFAPSLAHAQFAVRGEIEFASDVVLAASDRSLTGTVGLALRAHLEAEVALDPVAFHLTLDPTVRLAGPGLERASVEPGLTELFARYRSGAADIGAGLERLPLETARLSVPFRIEPLGRTGQPQGLLGIRAGVFLGDWRLRPAVVYRHQDDRLGGVVSVRRAFGDFELEAHALFLDGFAAGLGGSGLLGEIVVYGEAWLLADPWEGRGAFGLSGFWGDALWTAELAYAPSPLLPGGSAFPQLLGQVGLPHGDAGSWELFAGLGLVPVADGGTGGGPTALQGSTALLYRHDDRDHRFTTGISIGHGPRATVYGVRIGVTSFF